MWRFVIGFGLGWVVGGWYQRTGGDVDQGIGELKQLARGALDESARIVAESRRELQSVVEATGSPAAGSPADKPRAARRRSSPRRPRGQSNGEASA